MTANGRRIRALSTPSPAARAIVALTTWALLAFAWFAVLLSPESAAAQSATLAMTADRTEVSLGDVFRLQVRCDVQGAQPSEPELPSLDAFEILSRQVSRPMQFSMGWGGQQQVVQATSIYAFTLRARREGRVQLAPARAA